MRLPTLDPTAGETARKLRLNPDADPQVTDPTSPRYGWATSRVRELGGRVGRTVDPTDPVLGGRVGRVVDPTDPACAKRSD